MASAFKLIGSILKKKKKSEDDEEQTEPTDDAPKWKTGDHVVLKLDGIGDTVVPRGDMSDEEWINFVQEARSKQRLRGETVVETVEDKQLRKETGKSAFEDRPKSDYMEVTVGRGRGETAVVPRGDMDQTTWDALKSRAKMMGVFRSSNDTVKEKIKQGTGDVNRRAGPETQSTGMDADDTGNKEEPEVDQEAREELKLEYGDAGAPGVKGFVQRGLVGATDADPRGQETPDVPGAQKRRYPAGQKADIGEVTTSGGVPSAKDVISGVGRTIGTALDLPRQIDAALGFGPNPSDPQQMARAESILAPQVAGVGQTMSALAEGAGQLASGVVNPGGAQPAPAPAPGANPALAAGAGKMMGGGAAGAFGAMTPPGAAKPAGAGAPGAAAPAAKFPGENIGVTDRTKDIDAAFQNATRAQMAQAELESEGFKQKGRILDTQIAEQSRIAAKIADTQERVRKEREAPMKVYSQLVTDLMQPTQKVDPNRWWNSRSAGQKVMLAIGAMLTKGGNMQMIQHAIDADISAQQSDISNNRERQRTALSATNNMLDMIRQNGADDVQAQKIASALSWDMVSKRLEMIASNTDSQTVKLKAEQGVADANVRRNQLLTEMDKYSADLAIRKQHAQNEWEALQLKKAQAGRTKGLKLEHIKGPQLDKIASLQSAIQRLQQMQKELGGINKGSYLDAAGNWVASKFPKTDANRFDFNADLTLAEIANHLGKTGVLQDHDMKRWKKIHPSSSDPDAPYKLQREVDSLKSVLTNELKTFEAGGYSTGGMSAPAGGGVSSFQADDDEEGD